jgi:hypothetical protein
MVTFVALVWGRLVTCGGLVIRLVLFKNINGPIANRPQVTNLPHIELINSRFNGENACGFTPRYFTETFSATVVQQHWKPRPPSPDQSFATTSNT